MEDTWDFYIIENNGYTYAGVSNDPIKRLKKHNGEIMDICAGDVSMGIKQI